VTLRDALEEFPPTTRLLVFTTLGHVYVGTITDIKDDAILLARPGIGAKEIVLALGDVSGVRALTEEDEGLLP
jgi:ferredoxin-fold anticodon binding domain-containing protein